MLAILAYVWATSLMSSAESYRSPLSDYPPAPGIPLGTPLTRKVVIVLIDALRYDTSKNSTIMPFLNELREKGATATMHSQPPSFSAPGWTTILTGGWPDINDSQPLNPPDQFSARPFTQDNIFMAADRSGLTTAVAGYSWFKQMLSNSGLDAGFFTTGEDQDADKAVVAAALPWLTGDYQLILIHLDQVDYAGHNQGGPRNPNWNAAATRADGLLRDIVSTLDLTKDTVLVISDHGQIDQGGHGGPEPITLMEPFVLTGADIIPGQYGDLNMVDIAPTLAALLGTSIPSINEGQVLTQMLLLSPEQNSAIQDRLKLQQAELFSVYASAIGSTSSMGDGAVVTATQNAIKQARDGRLATERVWRNVIAALIALLPAYVLIIKRDKKILWLVAGAYAYILLFNFRYSILDGRTYSLSSVKNASWLITYTATTTVIASFLAWLIPMIGLRGFTSGPRHAAEISLGYVWFAVYLMALPILLSFAINGAIVTWTLPEFYTLFIGLLAIIQWIFIAAGGLALTGMAAIIGLLVRNTSLHKSETR